MTLGEGVGALVGSIVGGCAWLVIVWCNAPLNGAVAFLAGAGLLAAGHLVGFWVGR